MRRILKTVMGMFCAGLISGIVPATLSGADSTAAGSLTDAEFRRLHKQLRPALDEPWRTIPWKIALLDAQRDAARQQKPSFIWAMDGHPLGCT
jgi:hypothetical protein